MKRLRRATRFFGQDIFASDGRMRRTVTFFFGVFLSIPWLFIVIDLLLTNDHNEQLRVMQITVLLGFLHVALKFYCFSKLSKLREVFEYMESFYRLHSKPTEKYHTICMQYARITEQIMDIISYGATIMMTSIALCALIDMYVTREPLFHIYFPTVRHYSRWQFIMLTTLIELTALLTAYAVVYMDAYLILSVFHLTIIPRMVEWDLNDFSWYLGQRQINSNEIKRRLIQYMTMHMDFMRLSGVLETCFYKYGIIQFVTTTGFAILSITIVTKVYIRMIEFRLHF